MAMKGFNNILCQGCTNLRLQWDTMITTQLNAKLIHVVILQTYFGI